MAEKARHAFGSEANIKNALDTGKIDTFDILFLDEKKVGWINKQGEVVIAEGEAYVMNVTELPTSDGKANVVYIYNNEGYIWNGTECVPLAKSADLTTLETQVSDLETQMGNKVDATTVQSMIDTAVEDVSASEVVEF